MIDGDGFFVLKDGQNELYTRAGAFSFDTDGRLTNERGMIVQGWLGVNGNVNTNGALKNIVVPAGTVAPPIPSSYVTVSGNITSPGTPGEVFTLGVTVFDGNGLAHDLTIQLTRASDTDFTVDLLDADGNATGTSGSITFNGDGSVASNTDPTWDVPSTTPPSTVTVGISGLTQYGGQKTLSVTDKDGASSGTLQSIQIGAGRHRRRQVQQRIPAAPGRAGAGQLQQPERAGEGRRLDVPHDVQLRAAADRHRRPAAGAASWSPVPWR